MKYIGLYDPLISRWLPSYPTFPFSPVRWHRQKCHFVFKNDITLPKEYRLQTQRHRQKNNPRIWHTKACTSWGALCKMGTSVKPTHLPKRAIVHDLHITPSTTRVFHSPPNPSTPEKNRAFGPTIFCLDPNICLLASIDMEFHDPDLETPRENPYRTKVCLRVSPISQIFSSHFQGSRLILLSGIQTERLKDT